MEWNYLKVKMNIDTKTLVSDIVAANYKTATIFKEHGIDFCCNGNRSIEEVSNEKELDERLLMHEIKNCFLTEEDGNNYKTWNIDFLSEYIYNNHHSYVERQIPEIKAYLNKIVVVHGKVHPELVAIRTLFEQSANDLVLHMKKEELILFPYFKQLVKAEREGNTIQSRQFESIESPIAMMHLEHDNEGQRFREIAELSNNYQPPEDACTTYRMTYALLKAFEEDLHKHIHLENNILFKKGMELEKNLKKNASHEGDRN